MKKGSGVFDADQDEQETQYINIGSAAAFKLLDELHDRISNALDKGSKSVVFLCIGTDRSTGDSRVR